MEVHFEIFIASGRFGSLSARSSSSDIRRAFGEPDIFTPARKSYPMMLVYGDVEFVLRNDRLTFAAISLLKKVPSLPPTMILHGSVGASERCVDKVKEMLVRRGISWTLDVIMSEEGAPVFVTEKRVHLAFTQNILQRVGAEYI
ncbi:hypothetical protein [Dyadobacter pollutisoli]|uniref:Uncharacterized protein n=1 Tax=Dyadobacter pollutisoli TaxID=2910158 RepID=A0A9E8N4G6_9BACT|nr:hypothetical protein [Dyadobacter pollutisoli]WAC09595.1 hypothetical protein ON006_17735 [Dyadobacter pollutisoli]